MTTVHIEHPITSYAQWREAFDRAAPLRAGGGVLAHRVGQPVDDDRYVVVQLDFADDVRAAAFVEILRTKVWAVPANSPGLAGEPRTMILHALAD